MPSAAGYVWTMSIAVLSANRLSETVGIYSVGFLDAAATLFGKAATGQGLVDLTFYPAAYCLRHGLELLAKQMSIYFAYEMRDPDLLYLRGHSFHELWEKQAVHLDHLADHSWADGPELRHHIDVLRGTVEELHELDPGGTLFRYPEDVAREKGSGERVRTNRHVPFDLVNMGNWHAISVATLDAAQALLSEVAERIEFLRQQRGDPPLPLSDLVKRPTSADRPGSSRPPPSSSRA